MNVAQDLNHTMSPVNSISFYPAPHPAEPFEKNIGLRAIPGEHPSLPLLRAAAPHQHKLCSELLYSSLPKPSRKLQHILPQRNGFVHTVLEAYNKHRALVIRPDDVWLAILTQFSFFVNGNAEALRSTFVSHEGKLGLVVSVNGTRYAMDPAYMACLMTGLMEEHIVDPSLREWIMPSFTTTTTVDTSISAILMMGIMKEYFSYTFGLRCGIPKVTIEGEKSDWEKILHRLERLKTYGIQTIAWYHLLRPVISRIVAAYDNPDSPENLAFWNKVAHRSDGGSGLTWLSGWITAFCVFDEKGTWKGDRLAKEPQQGVNGANNPSELSAEMFASAYICRRSPPYHALDGFPYPQVDCGAIPCGYTHVDVKLDDNGEMFDTMFVAGSVGSQMCFTGTSQKGRRDAVRPLSAWWYFIKGRRTGTDA